MKYIYNQTMIQHILEEHKFLDHFSFDILPYIQIVEYDKGEYIIRPTDSLTHIFYLIKGTAKLYEFHKNGRQSLINFFTPPSFFGIPEFFELNKRPFPLVAHIPCLCIEVDTQRCRTQLLQDAQFLQFCCSIAFRQNVLQNRRYMHLTSSPSRNNFASCLILLQNNGILSFTYTDLAEYLAISYRHLMRLISEMCEEQIIERTPKGIKILDWDKIYSLAEEIHDDWEC